MNLLKFLLKESRSKIVIAAVCGLLSAASMTVFIRVVHRAIDPSLPNGDTLLYQFIGASLLFVLANLGGHLPLLRLTEQAVFKLRLAMIRNILTARFRGLEEIGSHRLYATLTTDVSHLVAGLAMIPGAIIMMAMLFGSLAYLVFLAWKALLGLVPFVLLLFVLFKFANGFASKKFTAAREMSDTIFRHLKTVAEGLKELKLHARRRHAFVDREVAPDTAQYRDHRVSGLSAFEYANALMALGFMATIGVLLFGLPVWLNIDNSVLSGAILVFMFMLNPLTKTFELLSAVAEANVALQKIDSLGLSLSQQRETPLDEKAALDSAWNQIQLDGVTHTYYNERKDEQFTLGPISAEIRPGEILFITGGNGSGKSTLAKLITALYEPENGEIHIDGQAVNDANREWYRQFFSTVFSDYFLFDNFLGIEDEHLLRNAQRYLQALHLDHKVKVEDNGLSTVNLSGGQRKRLALLIAYLEDRPIYLFDEWASDQDPQFKRTFYTEILPDLKQRGKAVIVISHDDRYFSAADRTLKLQDGQLAPEQAAATA